MQKREREKKKEINNKIKNKKHWKNNKIINQYNNDVQF